MDKRINAGFEIIEVIQIADRVEVVLGKRETRFGTEYVTWWCKDGTDYCHGHYIGSHIDARIDLYQRAIKELEGM